MQIGFSAPTRGPLSSADNLTRVVDAGEAIGFDYVTISDHVVFPADIQSRYPYSSSGEFPAGSQGDRQEQLTTAAFLAGRTSRLRLLTSVMVVPHRPAVLAAKMLATIDVLSRGRLIVGVGAGWLEEEFAALGTPPFAERGAVTDEYLKVFRALWTEAEPRFEGRYVRFADIVFAPKPAQKPHPPLWIGGEGLAAMRRTARLGDGWYPIGTNPKAPLDTIARCSAALGRLRLLAAESGREPASIALAYRCQKHGAAAPRTTDEGERHLLSGDAAEMAADLRALGKLGFSAVDFGFEGESAEATIANMRHFRDEVVARL